MRIQTVAALVALFCCAMPVNAQGSSSHATAQKPSSTYRVTRVSVDAESATSYGKEANDCYLEALKLIKQKKNCAALRMYTRAVVIRERIWGDRDPAVGVLLKQQAELFKKQGQWHECEQNYRRILAIDVKRYGPGSAELDKPLADLADICERQCNNTDALAYYQQLLAIRNRHRSPGCDSIKSCRLKLAAVLTLCCDYRAAEDILKDAIATEDSSPKPDPVYLVKCLDIYGSLLREMYRNEEALGVEQRQHDLQHMLRHPEQKPIAATVTMPGSPTAESVTAQATPAAPIGLAAASRSK